MSDAETQYLVVGEILKPWGYRGEVKVQIVTAFPKQLVKHKTVYLGQPARAFQVERARLHSGYAILKFAGYDTPESVAKLRGEIVQIPVEEAARLKKGQYYHHQIIGLNVVTETGEPIGTVAEILETGANDVYVVHTSEGKEILLPAIQSVIQAIDVENRTVTVTLLPGLLE
ncbi:MAG TPA: ribosome maturation factor RimM [Anaerolineae bacterium]|nr:ribosome maturation factor RimM [Anaerolineae bacterium]